MDSLWRLQQILLKLKFRYCIVLYWYCIVFYCIVLLLKYKLTFYSDHMFIEAGAYMSHPPPLLLGQLSLLQETIHWSVKYWASLCLHLQGDDWLSSLQNGVFTGFCQLMGLEPSQKMSTLLMSTQPLQQPLDVALNYFACRP